MASAVLAYKRMPRNQHQPSLGRNSTEENYIPKGREYNTNQTKTTPLSSTPRKQPEDNEKQR